MSSSALRVSGALSAKVDSDCIERRAVSAFSPPSANPLSGAILAGLCCGVLVGAHAAAWAPNKYGVAPRPIPGPLGHAAAFGSCFSHGVYHGALLEPAGLQSNAKTPALDISANR